MQSVIFTVNLELTKSDYISSNVTIHATIRTHDSWLQEKQTCVSCSLPSHSDPPFSSHHWRGMNNKFVVLPIVCRRSFDSSKGGRVTQLSLPEERFNRIELEFKKRSRSLPLQNIQLLSIVRYRQPRLHIVPWSRKVWKHVWKANLRRTHAYWKIPSFH